MTGSNSDSLLIILFSLQVWQQQESTSETLPLSTSLTMIVSALIKPIDIIFFISSSVLEIYFGESVYSAPEGSVTLNTPLTLKFRRNQNPFTITLSPVTVNTAESQGVGFFINSATITSRATAGSIYSYEKMTHTSYTLHLETQKTSSNWKCPTVTWHSC